MDYDKKLIEMLELVKDLPDRYEAMQAMVRDCLEQLEKEASRDYEMYGIELLEATSPGYSKRKAEAEKDLAEMRPLFERMIAMTEDEYDKILLLM